VWDESEYIKLPQYDGDMGEQSPAVFGCHQNDGSVCSGWLGHRNPNDLLAVRLGLVRGTLDVSCLEYETDVPLFASGAEAAAHGMKEVEAPGPAAKATIRKVSKVQARRKHG
jgi:hypothetical protein